MCVCFWLEVWSLPGGLFSRCVSASSRLIKGQTTSWLLMWSLSVCLQAWCWGACCSSPCVSGQQPCLRAGWTPTGSCGRRRTRRSTKVRYVMKKGRMQIRVFFSICRRKIHMYDLSLTHTVFDLMHSFCMSWGGGCAPQGIVGEEPDAHYHAQPGGLDGASHLRAEHEPHGRLGETLARSAVFLQYFYRFMIITFIH